MYITTLGHPKPFLRWCLRVKLGVKISVFSISNQFQDRIHENLICDDRINNTMSAEQSSKTAERQNVWKCDVCGKSFESEDMLNYHKLLEHSEHKRPPIGIG